MIAQLQARQVQGDDQVLMIAPPFLRRDARSGRVAIRREDARDLTEPRRLLGHPGAGGSHAFADPESGIAFAYAMNQMDIGVLPASGAHPRPIGF
ncbi:MAG: hypothetical protein R3F11_19930 [Verrucomicrobiales bacterium]